MKKNLQIGNASYQVHSEEHDLYLPGIRLFFEPYLAAALETLEGGECTAIDVGANIGLFSLLLADFFEKVYSIEPGKIAFENLQKNITNNNIDNISLFNISLGSENKRTAITYLKNNSASAFVADKSFSENTGYISDPCDMVTLDEICAKNKIKKISFIKIDVEGYELNVLSGAKNILKINKPLCYVECNSYCLNVFHNIVIREYIYKILQIFPHVYALDSKGPPLCLSTQPDHASFFHANAVEQRYMNLLCGFRDDQLKAFISAYRVSASAPRWKKALRLFLPWFSNRCATILRFRIC